MGKKRTPINSPQTGQRRNEDEQRLRVGAVPRFSDSELEDPAGMAQEAITSRLIAESHGRLVSEITQILANKFSEFGTRLDELGSRIDKSQSAVDAKLSSIDSRVSKLEEQQGAGAAEIVENLLKVQFVPAEGAAEDTLLSSLKSSVESSLGPQLYISFNMRLLPVKKQEDNKPAPHIFQIKGKDTRTAIFTVDPSIRKRLAQLINSRMKDMAVAKDICTPLGDDLRKQRLALKKHLEKAGKVPRWEGGKISVKEGNKRVMLTSYDMPMGGAGDAAGDAAGAGPSGSGTTHG